MSKLTKAQAHLTSLQARGFQLVLMKDQIDSELPRIIQATQQAQQEINTLQQKQEASDGV